MNLVNNFFLCECVHEKVHMCIHFGGGMDWSNNRLNEKNRSVHDTDLFTIKMSQICGNLLTAL